MKLPQADLQNQRPNREALQKFHLHLLGLQHLDRLVDQPHLVLRQNLVNLARLVVPLILVLQWHQLNLEVPAVLELQYLPLVQ